MVNKMNKVKELLNAGEPALGTWVTIQHPDVPEILSTLSLDWLMFDMEHAPADISTLETMLPAVDEDHVTPFVRVPWNDIVWIKRVLDLGVKGILVPYVNTKKEAKKVVKACQYPPQGVRGVGPRRATKYGEKDLGEYYDNFAETLVIGVQIETPKALENLDAILSVEAIDFVFIGPNDLSANLGVYRQFASTTYKKAVDKVLAICKEEQVAPGIFSGDPNEITDQIKKGFQFISIATDYGILRSSYAHILGELKGIR